MLYTLIIWTVVGVGGTSSSVYDRYDWRALTTHASIESCEQAARTLGYTSGVKYRCIKL